MMISLKIFWVQINDNNDNNVTNLEYILQNLHIINTLGKTIIVQFIMFVSQMKTQVMGTYFLLKMS